MSVADPSRGILGVGELLLRSLLPSSSGASLFRARRRREAIGDLTANAIAASAERHDSMAVAFMGQPSGRGGRFLEGATRFLSVGLGIEDARSHGRAGGLARAHRSFGDATFAVLGFVPKGILQLGVSPVKTLC
jgi:hypothetical protein